MFEERFRFKNYIISITLFILSLIIGIFIFFNCVKSSVEINSKETLTTNVKRQSEHLNTILNINYSYLHEIAQDMSKSDDLFSQDNLIRLQNLMNKTNLNRTALINTNGDALYDNEIIKNVSHRRYFKEAIGGQQTLSDPLESSVDNQTRVILGVPIYKDEKVIGVLGGSYNVTKLGNMLFDDLFDGKGNNFIVDQDGNIITKDMKFAKEYKIKQINNLFDLQVCRQKKLSNDFKNQKSGLVTIRTKNHGDLYLAYSPLKINNWMIGYVVPIKTAQSSYSFITKYEIIFIACFCVIVLLLLLYLTYKNAKEKKAILSIAKLDSLTNVYNKEATQELIDQKLKDQNAYCFLILDVDFFKQVNDNFGHMVGDKVLKELASLFKSHFRQNDIIGRIGGDEFVVLIDDKNSGEKRVQQLVEKVNQLQIDELNNHKLSISVGVAYAPKQGQTFMELYRHADMALYKMKRNGKNGYSIYENTDE